MYEPSVVALAEGTQEVVAVGDEAVRLEDAPETVIIVRPLRDGFAADYDLTAEMLRAFLKRVTGASGRFSSPDIILSVSSGASDAERDAALKVVRETAHQASHLGAPLAAALGAGVGRSEGAGSLVVNLGGSVTDIAVVRSGSVFAAESLRSAGYKFDEAIVRLARSKGVLIGELAAEAVKLELGAALDAPDPAAEETRAEKTKKVSGRDLTLGTPKTAHLGAREVTDALRAPLRKIVAGVQRVLETVPPELAADVINEGVALTGGGARLRGVAEFLHQQTGLPVRLADSPADCVVLGASCAFDHPDLRTETPSDLR